MTVSVTSLNLIIESSDFEVKFGGDDAKAESRDSLEDFRAKPLTWGKFFASSLAKTFLKGLSPMTDGVGILGSCSTAFFNCRCCVPSRATASVQAWRSSGGSSQNLKRKQGCWKFVCVIVIAGLFDKKCKYHFTNSVKNYQILKLRSSKTEVNNLKTISIEITLQINIWQKIKIYATSEI